jgi:hypothetical protein
MGVAADRVRAKRAADRAVWHKVRNTMRAYLRDNATESSPVQLIKVYGSGAFVEGSSATKAHLVFDQLNSYGEAKYVIGEGVYIGPHFGQIQYPSYPSDS